jgi:hypothetical protein
VSSAEPTAVASKSIFVRLRTSVQWGDVMGQKTAIWKARKLSAHRIDLPKQVAELKKLRQLVRRAEAGQRKASPSGRLST